jgi:hypothetical protein
MKQIFFLSKIYDILAINSFRIKNINLMIRKLSIQKFKSLFLRELDRSSLIV